MGRDIATRQLVLLEQVGKKFSRSIDFEVLAKEGIIELTPEKLTLGTKQREFSLSVLGVNPQTRELRVEMGVRTPQESSAMQLRKFQIVPSDVTGDSEFLRRVCLDLTGTLPPPSRVRQFLASNDPQKRDKLIEILLSSPEHSDFWTFRFADLLRVGPGGRGPDQQMYWEWLRKSIATNKPYDQIARERIAAQGYQGPTRHYLSGAKVPAMEKAMAEQMRVFMGRRLECAQCHDHPSESWTQNQFWGLAAFFGRMTETGWIADQVILDDPDGQEENYGVMGQTSLSFLKPINPRSKRQVAPTFLDGQVLPEAKRMDLRMELATWMSSHPYFAEAAVNRIWGYFFGRGIVDPVDDFRSTNAPTHPELLQTLAQDFKEHGYNLKHLMRRIVQSSVYQLSSEPNPTNRGDQINYSHALPRPLEAEVLLDAISNVTGVPEVFETDGKEPPGTRAINLQFPASYPSRFMDVYGRPLRSSVPERDNKPSLGQALHMLVGSTYTQKLSKEGTCIDRLLKRSASDREIIEEFYLAAFSRFPAPAEQTELEKGLADASSRRDVMEDLLWALISSREFVDNH
jgi:hypothetical protein